MVYFDSRPGIRWGIGSIAKRVRDALQAEPANRDTGWTASSGEGGRWRRTEDSSGRLPQLRSPYTAA